jgi:hypothetical protein
VRTLRVKVNKRIGELRQQKRAIEQTLEELLVIDQQAQDWLNDAPANEANGKDMTRD